MNDAYLRIIDALRANGRHVIERGNGTAQAQCPCANHGAGRGDNHPSLSIAPRKDGKGINITCHAGCDYRDVLAAVGLTPRDLYDDDDGMRDVYKPNVDYVYPNGKRKKRRTKPDGKSLKWERGPSGHELYMVDKIPADCPLVYLVESEKSAQAVWAMGAVAVSTGGATRECDMTPLRGVDIIAVVDRDSAGLKWAERQKKKLDDVAASLKFVRCAIDIPKADVVEHLDNDLNLMQLDEFDPFTTTYDDGHDDVDDVYEHVDDVVHDDVVHDDVDDDRHRDRDDDQRDDDRRDDRCDEPAPPTPHGSVSLCVEHLENGFWERESLAAVYTAALARMCSPWAVLAHCAARALTVVRPTVTLPPLIGGPGSLNWFGAVAAPSGGGKGSASALARFLVPNSIVCRNLGSGEGMIGAYSCVGDDGKPKGTYEAMMFVADEIDTMSALGARTGSTTMSVLRAAFSGETLGHSYVSRDKNVHLPAGAYRMTMVVSVQPQRAAALIDGHHGGTPQRFQWFPGIDRRITADPAQWTAQPLNLPAAATWEIGIPWEISIPDAARKLILTERAKAMRGEADELDGHALFVREKFAYALAVLDGRAEMNDEDWQLSGVAAAVSAHVRDTVAQLLSESQRRDAAETGALHGVSQEAADTERAAARDERIGRVARRVLAKLAESRGRMKHRDLISAIAYRDRPVLHLALATLVESKLIRRLDDTAEWVTV